MEVAVSALRAELRAWLERARGGEDVVVTERGVPVARLVAVDGADLLTSLIRDGLLSPPTEPRERTGVGAVSGADSPSPSSAPAAPDPADRDHESRGMTGLVRRLRR